MRSFGTKPLKSGAYRPDLVVFLNPSDNLGAIKECTARNIPTVGVVDTDTDPRIVTYPIPANMEVSVVSLDSVRELTAVCSNRRADRRDPEHSRTRGTSIAIEITGKATRESSTEAIITPSATAVGGHITPFHA